MRLARSAEPVPARCIICTANLANHRRSRRICDVGPIQHRMLCRRMSSPRPIIPPAPAPPAAKEKRGTANHAKHANGARTARGQPRGTAAGTSICVFCVICGSLSCCLSEPEAASERPQRDRGFSLVAATGRAACSACSAVPFSFCLRSSQTRHSAPQTDVPAPSGIIRNIFLASLLTSC